MGHYGEAQEDLGVVRQMLTGEQSAAPELLPLLSVAEARMLLSLGRFPEAEAKSREALAQAGPKPSEQTAADVNMILCLARSLSGAAGAEPCGEAARMAEATKDQALAAEVRLALAEALAEVGGPQAALDAARLAHEFYARVGRAESEWRALAAAGRAARRAGDTDAAREYLARAAQALSRLEQQWGSEAAASYTSRPDVQRLRSGLGG
jgi:tetratricopeptide (TPR) repeat protein